MSNQDVEKKPSETALFTALRRALAHLEYQDEKLGPDRMAIHFLPPHFRFFLKFTKIQANTWQKLAAAFPGMNEYVIARTAHFDQLFVQGLQDRMPQIVLLGAGYDSRAYRFSGLNQASQVFELDIAPTQDRKKQCLKAAHIPIPPQVKLVPVDFNRESIGTALKNAGYQNDQKTLFLWEGVSYYLDPAAVDATLAFASQAAPGSRMAFDYVVTITEANQDLLYGAQAFVRSMHQQHANEGITFSLDEGQIEAFLAQRGLQLVEHLDHTAIASAYLLDQNGTPLGRLAGYFRFVTASPMVSP